jgi:hypothetical protein
VVLVDGDTSDVLTEYRYFSSLLSFVAKFNNELLSSSALTPVPSGYLFIEFHHCRGIQEIYVNAERRHCQQGNCLTRVKHQAARYMDTNAHLECVIARQNYVIFVFLSGRAQVSRVA